MSESTALKKQNERPQNINAKHKNPKVGRPHDPDVLGDC